MRGVVDHLEWLEAVIARGDNELLAGLNGGITLGTKSLAVPVLKILNIGEPLTC